MASSERLQKLMARAGLGSRRACEQIIRNGRVTLNGRLAVLGDRADPAVDQIRVDGEPLRNQPERITVALYKPAHFLTTDAPHWGDERPTARSLISLEERLFPVGRLDADSEGSLYQRWKPRQSALPPALSARKRVPRARRRPAQRGNPGHLAARDHSGRRRRGPQGSEDRPC